MNIFISWAGSQTKIIAYNLKELLFHIFNLKAFLSSEILKGEEWFDEIIENLKKANFGIILVTPKNLTSSWLNFEIGALKMSAQKLCPVVFGLDPSELPSPLNQFQASKFSQNEFYILMSSINQLTKPILLTDEELRTKFLKYWPYFSEEVNIVLREMHKNDNINEYPDSSDIKRIERVAFAAMRQKREDISLFERKLEELILLNDYPMVTKLKVITNLGQEIPLNSDIGTRILIDKILFLIAGWESKKLIETIGQQHDTNAIEWAKMVLDEIDSCLNDILYNAKEYGRNSKTIQKVQDARNVITEKRRLIQ